MRPGIVGNAIRRPMSPGTATNDPRDGAIGPVAAANAPVSAQVGVGARRPSGGRPPGAGSGLLSPHARAGRHLHHRLPAQLLQHVRPARARSSDGRLRRIEPHPDNRATPERRLPEGAQLLRARLLARPPAPPAARRPGTDEFERHRAGTRRSTHRRRALRPARASRARRASSTTRPAAPRGCSTALARASGACSAAARRPTATSAGRRGSRPRA